MDHTTTRAYCVQVQNEMPIDWQNRQPTVIPNVDTEPDHCVSTVDEELTYDDCDIDWCKIYFYQYSNRIGNEFIGGNRCLHIRNQPCGVDTFNVTECLADVRSSDTLKNLDGDGISLLYADGVVYVSNMTSDRIYLQSWVGNEMLNHHKSTVIDIAPGLRGIGIFDLTIYAELMNRTAERMSLALRSHNYEDQQKCNVEFDKMRHRCIVRISLARGFGEDFPAKVIKDCPCWFEVHLSTPLLWLNKVMEYFAQNSSRMNQSFSKMLLRSEFDSSIMLNNQSGGPITTSKDRSQVILID